VSATKKNPGPALFWTALSLAGGSPLADDIADTAAYVTSLGPLPVAQFEKELRRLHEQADAAGLSSTIRAALIEHGAEEVTDDLVQRSVERLAIANSSYFERGLSDPTSVVGQGCNEIRLRVALERAAGGQVGTVDPSAFSPQMIPLRRDGWSPWISILTGVGVGLRINSLPFSDPYFLSRFSKQAAIASQTSSWQELRRDLQIRELNIVLEFWPDGTVPDAEDLGARRRSSTRIETRIVKELPPLKHDLRRQGDEIAQEVLAEAHDILTSAPIA